MYNENYETLMKEIEEDTHEWKNCCVLGSEELILPKCTYCPKSSVDSMQSQPKFQWHFHINRKRIILKFVYIHDSIAIMKNKSKAAGITFSDFMLYTAIVIN